MALRLARTARCCRSSLVVAAAARVVLRTDRPDADAVVPDSGPQRLGLVHRGRGTLGAALADSVLDQWPVRRNGEFSLCSNLSSNACPNAQDFYYRGGLYVCARRA